jgi:hypothetical protein
MAQGCYKLPAMDEWVRLRRTTINNESIIMELQNVTTNLHEQQQIIFVDVFFQIKFLSVLDARVTGASTIFAPDKIVSRRIKSQCKMSWNI